MTFQAYNLQARLIQEENEDVLTKKNRGLTVVVAIGLLFFQHGAKI